MRGWQLLLKQQGSGMHGVRSWPVCNHRVFHMHRLPGRSDAYRQQRRLRTVRCRLVLSGGGHAGLSRVWCWSLLSAGRHFLCGVSGGQCQCSSWSSECVGLRGVLGWQLLLKQQGSGMHGVRSWPVRHRWVVRVHQMPAGPDPGDRQERLRSVCRRQVLCLGWVWSMW